jgi:hypothetical protein
LKAPSRTGRLRGSRSFQVLQNFFSVPFSFDVVEDVRDFSLPIDDKSRTRDSFYLFPIHIFFFDYAEGFTDFLVRIRQQRVRQLILILKFLLGLRRIGGDTQDYGTGFLQLFVCVAEPARFNGSAGSVGLGKEEENDGLAAKILQ